MMYYLEILYESILLLVVSKIGEYNVKPCIQKFCLEVPETPTGTQHCSKSGSPLFP